MLRKLFATPFRKIGCILLGVAVFVFAASWYMRPRPDERNRIVSPAGYSIIRPDGWSADMRPNLGATQPGETPVRDVMTLSPDRFLGNPPKLSVNHFMSRPDLDSLRAGLWTDGMFQGEKAMVFEHQVKRLLIRGAIFERAGQWFRVAESLPNAESIRVDDWWRFIETFRYPEPGFVLPTATSTTAPATPSTEPFNLPAADQ